MSGPFRPRRGARLTPLLFLVMFIALIVQCRERIFGPATVRSPAAAPPRSGEYLFCTWNVENLFDDRNDHRRSPDEEYDNWFASRPADRELKYNHLAEELLRLNGGKGPDILALVEVESIRAAELLRDLLNQRLPPGATPYGDVQMKEVTAGRHIAPAVLSRVPVKSVRGFNQYRILEVRCEAGGKELIVLASHWTSHKTDEGSAGKRDRYASIIYGVSERIFRTNPKADILVCGDFNDGPDAEPVVSELHAGGDSGKVAASRHELQFLNLMAGKDPQRYGTHYYKKPVIYDQVCISPGLLDNEGWSCDPESIHTETEGLIRPGATRRQPWRFGNRRDSVNRGYSDHFPVTVKLKVEGPIP
jgi:endonuclease/exonuclease/phosphatase family metal-dependent hydrolase